jgi:O-antigen ligase
MHQLFYLAAGLALVILAARNPDWGIFGTAAALPMTQSVDTGIPGFNAFNLLIFSLVIGLFLRAETDGPRFRFPVWLPLTLLSTIVLWGWINGAFIQHVPPVEEVRPFSRWETFLVLKEIWCLGLLTLLCFWAARTPEDVSRYVTLVVAGMSVEVLFCFFEWIRKMGRITGHLRQPNSLGAFMCLAAVTAVTLFVASKGGRRWLYLLVGIGAAFACIMSRSRGGLLSLFAGLLLISLLRNRKLTVVLIILAVTYRAWLPEAVVARIDEAYVVDEGGDVEAADTAAQRITIWRAAEGMIRDRPAGIGLGTFAHFSALYGTAEDLKHPNKNAHNEFVRVAAELSPVGLFVLLWLLFGVVRSSFRCYRYGADRGLQAAGLAGLAAVIGIGLPSLFGTFLFQAVISGHFWMLAGIVCKGDCLARQDAWASSPALRRAVPEDAVLPTAS